MGLGSVIAAVDDLVAADPQTLGDGQTLVELHRQLARLEAVVARASAAFDASKEWASDGAQVAAMWLTVEANIPKQVAQRRIRLGRALRHLPVAESAWLSGDVTADHVAALARARTPETEEAMERDEAELVGEAKRLRFASFCRLLRYWLLRESPDEAEREDEAKFDRRSFHLSRTFQEMWVGDLTLDPVSGAIVSRQLQAIYDEFFKADWTEAKERLGREPTVLDLDRTPAQRRADALVEMAIRAGTAPKNGQRPAPLFSVFVNWETFAGPICELANGSVVTPGTLVPWLDPSYVERVVFESPSRVIDVGVTQRLFRGATRRALEVRDRECTDKYCDVPSEDCQGDHVLPYTEGGLTTQDNGQMVCGFHNRLRWKDRAPPDEEEE